MTVHIATLHPIVLPQILRLEEDAGGEFRSKIRLLERNLANEKVKVQGLEHQLTSSEKHTAEYKDMSQSYETQLMELNSTTKEFKWVGGESINYVNA